MPVLAESHLDAGKCTETGVLDVGFLEEFLANLDVPASTPSAKSCAVALDNSRYLAPPTTNMDLMHHKLTCTTVHRAALLAFIDNLQPFFFWRVGRVHFLYVFLWPSIAMI